MTTCMIKKEVDLGVTRNGRRTDVSWQALGFGVSDIVPSYSATTGLDVRN